eukprot:INCI7002.1.p1 GENE.INCI7002.1~~INCI7002.1.p1  ORF type:complete len:406 (-),score=74.83 INCI7002.1:1046-2227(-)
MSALQAVQADGFYNPPDWDPTKIGRDQFQRSKGKNQFETSGLVRFELMYNSWCLGCKRAIGRGTRYNARKLKPTSGPQKYFSTQIWEFRMKCATCPQEFVIRTDPKNRDYDFVSGIRRINSTPTAAQAETFDLKDDATAERLGSDAFFHLEHHEKDKRKAMAEKTIVARLQRISDINHKDDYRLNRLLRAKVRGARRQRKALAKEGREIGFGFALLPASAEDEAAAAAEAEAGHFRTRTAPATSASVTDSTSLSGGPLDHGKSTAMVVASGAEERKKSVSRKRSSDGRHRGGDGSKALVSTSRSSISSTRKKKQSGESKPQAAALVTTAARDGAAELQKRRRFEIRAGSIFGSASKAQTTAAKLAALHAKRRRLGIKAGALKLAQRGRKLAKR